MVQKGIIQLRRWEKQQWCRGSWTILLMLLLLQELWLLFGICSLLDKNYFFYYCSVHIRYWFHPSTTNVIQCSGSTKWFTWILNYFLFINILKITSQCSVTALNKKKWKKVYTTKLKCFACLSQIQWNGLRSFWREASELQPSKLFILYRIIWGIWRTLYILIFQQLQRILEVVSPCGWTAPCSICCECK